MDLTCQDEERWCAWLHAGALFSRLFDYCDMSLPRILRSKPAHESQVMISMEGFGDLADVRSKWRSTCQGTIVRALAPLVRCREFFATYSNR